jgi:hypothetical protein
MDSNNLRHFRDAIYEIDRVFIEAASPYNDGYTSCMMKHQLWLLNKYIEAKLERCPEFPRDEAEWQAQWEKKKIMEILNNETS